jgi:glycine oxidase
VTSAHPATSARGKTVVVDVVIVGAGLIGLATAWELRRRGRKVAVIDPAPGQGASRAAAGMLAPISEVQYQQNFLNPLMSASAAEYPRFAAAVEQACGESVGYRATETLVCGVDQADRQALTDLSRLQQSYGMAVASMALSEARILEPALSPRLSSVFRIPTDHQVDPRRLVSGLLTALAGRRTTGTFPDGGPAHVLRGQAKALRWNGSGAVAGIELADGQSVLATETILAPGLGVAGLEGLPDTCRMPLRPVHGDILRARIPPGTPHLIERTVRGLVHGLPVYLVPRADGTVVIGATSREDNQAGPSAGGVFRLLRDAQALVPGVAELELTETMARARPGTPDDAPYLGRIRSVSGEPVAGLVISTGYFRHGVLLAPLAARLASQLVTGQVGADPAADAAHLSTTDPHRFPVLAIGRHGVSSQASTLKNAKN